MRRIRGALEWERVCERLCVMTIERPSQNGSTGRNESTKRRNKFTGSFSHVWKTASRRSILQRRAATYHIEFSHQTSERSIFILFPLKHYIFATETAVAPLICVFSQLSDTSLFIVCIYCSSRSWITRPLTHWPTYGDTLQRQTRSSTRSLSKQSKRIWNARDRSTRTTIKAMIEIK